MEAWHPLWRLKICRTILKEARAQIRSAYVADIVKVLNTGGNGFFFNLRLNRVLIDVPTVHCWNLYDFPKKRDVKKSYYGCSKQKDGADN